MSWLEGRMFFRQLASQRSGAQHSPEAMQYRTHVVPRTAALIGPAQWPRHRIYQVSLFIDHPQLAERRADYRVTRAAATR